MFCYACERKKGLTLDFPLDIFLKRKRRVGAALCSKILPPPTHSYLLILELLTFLMEHPKPKKIIIHGTA